jgi:excisionase family DNA binding protein
MEKICIVKRRRVGFGTGTAPRLEMCDPAYPQRLTLEMTPEQMERIWSNTRFQSLYGTVQAPIVLNLHLETSFLAKMLKSAQICDMLQISKSTLQRLVKAGVFRSHRIGRMRRFAVEDVMEYLSRSLERNGLRSVRTASVFARPFMK